MDITTATPVEIDTQLADIYRRANQAEQKVEIAVVGLHYGLGERPNYVTRTRKEWPATTAEALAACRNRGDEYNVMYGKTFADMAAKYDTAVTALAAIEAEADVLNAEFNRRGGWSRFFTVQNNGGHIHSSMSCQTCNKRGLRTDFGWNPELSGLTMEQAITRFDRHAHILCTVCFPAAPVEWTVRDRAAAATTKAAKAAAEQAARLTDPKLIGAPDGAVLRVDGDTLRTVRAAQIAMGSHLFWALYAERGGNSGDGRRWHARQIAEALAAKLGEQADDILAAAEVKAKKKLGR
ncbi:hypothetical protein ABZ671_01215 [Micromonospora sp. NPDC006766]|uniref:hypothetical protein n=1 Tax=Micromonospora sp. NPDC006766 TaxID=3154778 RepID=UPI0033D428E0